jgi:hypothetical protein
MTMSILLCATLLALQAGKDLPLQLPDGWESKREEGVLMITPKQVDEGRIYTVLVPPLTKKLGKLRLLLDAGKESLAEVGKFTPATDPVAGKSGGQWDFEFVIGTLAVGEKQLMAQATGLIKGEDEGVILVLSDSVETMLKYGDGLSAMLRSVGAPKAAPPAGAGVARSAKDLKFTLPPGWEAKEAGGEVILEKWEQKGDPNLERKYSLIILGSAPLRETLRKEFLATWKEQITPIFETKIAPLPMMRRLKSGLAVAYDVDDDAKNVKKVTLIAGLYVLSQGKRVVPIVAVFNGFSPVLEADLLQIFESASIADAGEGQAPLYDAAEFAGEWNKSSVSLASFVTSSGGYAGDASMSIDITHILNADGTFTYKFTSVGRTAMHIERKGTWKLDDMYLTCTEKDKAPYGYRLFGYGSDPKVGRFMVMAIAAGTAQQLDLSNPRRSGGSWYKRKD